MRRGWIAAALACAIVTLAPAVRAYQNEPTGFRGIAWGTPVDTVRAKVETWYNRDVDPGLVEYRSRSDLTMNGIPLNFNFYQFYKGQFAIGIMDAYSAHCASMLRTLVARFGQPDQKRGRNRFLWHGQTTTIAYICSKRGDYCRVGLESTALMAARDRDLTNSARKNSDF